MHLSFKFKSKERNLKTSFSFKRWFAAQNKLGLIFKFFGLLSLLFWIAWVYFEGIRPVEVKVPRRTQNIINLDQKAYKSTAAYIESVKQYQLPDFNSLYDNPEPFVEYVR